MIRISLLRDFDFSRRFDWSETTIDLLEEIQYDLIELVRTFHVDDMSGV